MVINTSECNYYLFNYYDKGLYIFIYISNIIMLLIVHLLLVILQ